MVFNRNRPTAGEKLSNSQPLIRDNFNSSDDTFGVDHYAFSDTTANNGRHKDIHIVKRVGDPAAVVGTGIIFSKDYTPNSTGATVDQQLFTESGSGKISQLTGYSTSSVTNGWQWVGGILIQWGQVTFAGNLAHATSTVTFKDRVVGAIPFPNNIFIVNGTLQVASSTETVASNILAIRSFSKTQFVWVFNSSSSTGSTKYPGFYWTAIGN